VTGGEVDHGRLRRAVDAAAQELVDLSHDLHAHPELAMQEVHAHNALTAALERHGFAVERHAHGIETAFAATVGGGGGPHVVVCAEYDALPRIGHACGHNVIAAAALGTGIAAAPLATELGMTLTVLGTPAEEAVGGKALLVEAGAFAGATAALMVHPAPLDIREAPALAVQDLVVTVHGRAAHAALSPTRQGNALDGLVEVHRLLSTRHFGEWERCHGVITDGGDVANVVPEKARAHYFVRARTGTDAASLESQLRDEISAAVAEFGCTVEFASAMESYREMKHNHLLAGRYQAHAEASGRDFVPQMLIGPESASSTDMGNVSQVVPSIHPMIGIASGPHLPHQRGFAAAAVSESADRAILDAAVALASVVVDLGSDPKLVAEVQADFETHDSVGEPV